MCWLPRIVVVAIIAMTGIADAAPVFCPPPSERVCLHSHFVSSGPRRWATRVRVCDEWACRPDPVRPRLTPRVSDPVR
jgi:hypothetical protein